MKRSWVALAGAALLAAGSLALAQATGGETLHEDWMLMRMSGAEIGHSHTLVQRVRSAEGAPRIRSVLEAKISIGRLGSNVDLSMGGDSLEDPQGRLLETRSVMKLSSTETVVVAKLRDGKFQVQTTNFGSTSESTLDAPGTIVGPYGIELLRGRMLKKQPGTTYEYRTFSGEMGARIVSVKGKVVGPVEKEILGETRSLVELREETDLMPGLEGQVWVDAEGRSVMESTPVAGGMDTIRVSRERALAGSGGKAPAGSDADLIVSLSIRSNVRLPYPYRVESVLYEIEVKQGDVDAFVRRVASRRQEIVKREGKRVWLRIRKTLPPPGAAYDLPYRGARDLDEYLSPNTWLQADDPVLRKAARDAVGDEKDAWAAAKKLEHWVYEHIRNKNLTVGFASAREVCDSGEGDCSEHAVLLAGALRAVGIPSRIAMGVLYFNGIFAGHAWTEAYVGTWVPLDATMARPFVDAVHVSFGYSSLADEGMDALMGTGAALGNVDFKILEYTLDGRTVRVDESFHPYTVDGDVYRNELYGIEIRKPADWTFENLDSLGFGTTLLEILGKGEGGEDAGEIRVTSLVLPYNRSFLSVVDALAGRGGKTLQREESTIGGRRAVRWVMEEGGGGAKRLHAAVAVDELLFHLSASYGGEKDAARFRRVLDGVRWIGSAAAHPGR